MSIETLSDSYRARTLLEYAKAVQDAISPGARLEVTFDAQGEAIVVVCLDDQTSRLAATIDGPRSKLLRLS